jgi:hypothetical protein
LPRRECSQRQYLHAKLGNATRETTIADKADPDLDAQAAWWQSTLRGERPILGNQPEPLKIVDAFCGSGGFPDWFDFAPPQLIAKRKNLAKWIGDAVHPILGYAVGLSVLAAMEEAAKSEIKVAA